MRATPSPAANTADLASCIRLALALSLGAAVSLGITRFAYGLLLPPMRDDLGWSYTLAGAMNTFNAVGYLIGALATPWLMRRFSPTGLLIAGSLGASLFMGLSGFFTAPAPLLVQRLLAGVASALVFIAGGLLAARLGARQPQRSGFLLGIYYGGTGLGIVISALGVPPVLAAAAGQPHGWAWAWWALAAVCLLATALMAWPARALANQPAPVASTAAGGQRAFRLRDFAFALAGYAGFGVGYIGYMTFVIALLREQGSSSGAITLFYALLGLAVVASSRIWAGLLDRHRNGQALARLNALLGLAAIVPALTRDPVWVIASGLLFGGVFLSVVASTTALVRHNLPPAQWAAGISAFTIVFAAGQIVGPTVVGFIADGSSGAQGLREGLVFSAVALWIGAALALRQRAL
ncbi:MAG: YbfB/YjiJ family MFS transporter [Hydrogenophaga sp.]|uniref:YbfB/YjiJ family MFS transporter n=1 Tax=Hydrogenophaga sp. TaxID=1904254 RepID=UPI002617C5F2|nr:YbfB/YjiJ family MFS transporter [Hydrogenophaga sp.]MDM7942683.1 YbfB/YjiJ family MFS transporter [Hydrogenophaga sp.]